MLQTMSSDAVRSQWRTVVDTAMQGKDIVVQRYGKPAVAIIAYEDFIALQEMLEDLRDLREAQEAMAEWKQDPTSAIDWEEAQKILWADQQDP